MNKESKEFLLELLNTPSPSGCEQEIQKNGQTMSQVMPIRLRLIMQAMLSVSSIPMQNSRSCLLDTVMK
jgi:hypothetical protein